MARFLTKEEELTLGGMVQNMVKAKARIDSGEELSEGLTTAIKAQIALGEKAVATLVESNQKLVYKRARMFKSRYPGAPELEDIIQDGMAGLVTAIMRFDPSRNNKLSTVATYWIFQSISRQTNKVGRLVRLPENRVNDYSKITKLRKEYEAKGIENTSEIDELIMYELKLTSHDYQSIVNAASSPTSLNREISDGESTRELIDMLPQESVQSVEVNVIRDAMKTVLDETIENLSEIERDTLKASFLIGENANILKPKEVKQKHRITTPTFEKHLASALRTVKREMNAHGVTYNDFLEI